MQQASLPPSSTSSDATTARFRRALSGEVASLAWLVGRFSPPLLLQARHHLGLGPHAIHDPEDLVNEVWAVALPRLSRFKTEAGPPGPAILVYLSRILLRLCARLQERRARGCEPEQLASSAGDVPAEVSGVVSRAIRSEAAVLARRLLGRLDDLDRAVVALHGIERLSYERISERLGVSPNRLRVHYRRSLVTLRAWLPGTAFIDLLDD